MGGEEGRPLEGIVLTRATSSVRGEYIVPDKGGEHKGINVRSDQISKSKNRR